MALIEWTTVAAQIVNFLILAALLKYLLYGRIAAVVDARRDAIEQEWKEVDRTRTDVEAELNAARERAQAEAAEREQMLGDVRDEVTEYRRKLTAEVREEIEQLKERWNEALREESGAFLRDLRRRIADETCVIARLALADLADTGLEEQAVRVFLNRLEHLESGEREKIIQSFEDRGTRVVIRSAFELPPALRQTISRALREHLLPDLEADFETSADLLCGIELHTDDHKLSWELADYLEDLEREVARAIEEESAITTS